MEHSYMTQVLQDDEEENVQLRRDLNENTDEDAFFIDLVRSYPHLYDKKARDYKDATVKANSWEEIAGTLEKSGKL